ncbi:MAG TPA: DUF2730 family protein, partial [Rhizobiales bacterium]|nr:DUF2730 family protein [Hyphomicrobiales bacterium]
YVLLGIYVWFTNKQKATRAEIRGLKRDIEAMRSAVEKGCNKHKSRTLKLEEAVKSAPTHADIGAVYDRVNMVKGSVDEMAGGLKGVNTQLRLLVEHHLNGSGK